jgi:hypothetical protein
MTAAYNNARDSLTDVKFKSAEVAEVQASSLVVAFDFLVALIVTVGVF